MIYIITILLGGCFCALCLICLTLAKILQELELEAQIRLAEEENRANEVGLEDLTLPSSCYRK
jgi:hypothetical protein